MSSIQQIGASFGENESFERALPPIENDDQMKNSFERGLICGISIHNVFVRNQIADVKLQLLKLGQNKCLMYMNW